MIQREVPLDAAFFRNSSGENAPGIPFFESEGWGTTESFKSFMMSIRLASGLWLLYRAMEVATSGVAYEDPFPMA